MTQKSNTIIGEEDIKKIITNLVSLLDSKKIRKG